MNRLPENAPQPKKCEFSANEYRFDVPARACAEATCFACFISDWMKFKIVECDWFMNLRSTGYPFDKTNDYKIMKQNNDSKCLFFKTQ